MEEDFNDIDVNNEILSLSYVQGISRITGSKEEDVSILHIPEDVILQRKEVWNKLFLKYSEHVSDETELDIHTFEPIEENNESLELNYRLPMRKPSYLVQYWVDTGMPPCKALDENNRSEPESSLSEYEQSPQPVSDNLNLPQYKNIQPLIRCTSSSSSIDTAVYILSNTNTTKKADTIAIMEGAKPCDTARGSDNVGSMTSRCETLIPTQEPTLQPQETPLDIHSETTESLFHKRNSQPLGPLENNKSTSSPLISDNEKENSSDDTHTDNELNFSLRSANFERLLKSPLFNNTFYNNTPQYSSNKSDILDISFQSTSSAHRAQNANNLESDSDEETSQRVAVKKPVKKTRSRRLARVENTTSKNRRKLYTCRNSPVDLITPVVKEVGKLSPIKEAAKVKQSLHPALETPHSTQNKTLMIMKRAKMRARMKLKKALLSSTLGDTSQESDPNMSLDSTVPNDETVNDAVEFQKVTATERQDKTVAPSNLADTCKVLSTNLNPVVRLERIDVESYKELMKLGKRNATVEDGNQVKKSTLTKQNLLDMEAQIGSTNDAIMYSITNCSYVEIDDSDQSTIIMCKCTNNSVQSKAFSESHCNDNFAAAERYSNSSKLSLDDVVECENNNNSTELEDALKLKVSIEELNKLTAHQTDQEEIDDAEVSEIMKHSEICDRIASSSELQSSEPKKISDSSVKLLPRRSVNLQTLSNKNWQFEDDRAKDASARCLRSGNKPIKSKSSKRNVSMTLRARSQAQIDRMRKCDDDEISCTSSLISNYINEIKSIEDAKREAIANAGKLVIRLERLPSNILANKYKKYEHSVKKRKVVEIEEMPRKFSNLSEQPKVIKVTKRLLSKIRNKNNINNYASDNSLSCSEESSNSGVTKKLEPCNIDVIKNGKINSSLSQNNSTALVTIGSTINNICISSEDCSESVFKSSQSVNWLPSDVVSSTDDDDIFNILKPTRRSERRKTVRHIFNISDTSSTNLLRKSTRSNASSKIKRTDKSTNVNKESSESLNKREKTKRSSVYSSSEILSKDSGKGTDSSSRMKSTEILTVNDIIFKPKKTTRGRSKTLSVLCTATGWKNKKAQRTTRNMLSRSEGITSESSDKNTLQERGRFIGSRKLRFTKSLISSDSSAVSSVKKKASPSVRLNRRSSVKKLHTTSSDETSVTSNSALITKRNKCSVRKADLRTETVKSTSPRRSKLPLSKNAQNTRRYTRLRSAPLDFTSDSTEGNVMDQKSIDSTRKKRKVEKKVSEKSIVPKNDDKRTGTLAELFEKYRNNISDVSCSSSDVNVRCTKLLPQIGSQSTESKYNSQISTTFEKLTNETRTANSNDSLSFLQYLDNTSDESLISFSSTRGNFEKSKRISITKATMRKTPEEKSPEVRKPVVYQAITFHGVSDSDT